jgi:cardiolipin synthase (CMP-forming)
MSHMWDAGCPDRTLREPGWDQEGPEVQPSQQRDPADRLLTVPNVLSLLRLAGVPLFLWLLLGRHHDLLAVLVLALSGLTDWLDGKLARLLN